MKWLTFVLLIYALSSCIVSLENDHELNEDILVVEGFIDNDFGPHEIKVTYLAQFAGILEGGEVRRVEASVAIVDEFGNRTDLIRESGTIRYLAADVGLQSCTPIFKSRDFQTNYLTPATFRGEPGVAYLIEIADDRTGKMYRSSFTRMPQPISLDSILFEFKSFPSADEDASISGVDVFANWTDPAESGNHYWWEMEGTYKLETPQLAGQTCCVYDQSDEFGTRCWKVERAINGSLAPLSDEDFNGRNTIEKVGFIEDDGLRFSSDAVPGEKQYHLKVSQYAISEAAYEYLIKMRTLSEIDGEIFDPPPVTLVSNVYNLDDPEEVVVGYFGVYSKGTLSTFMNRNVLLERKKHRLCGDCRHFQFQGQIEIPDVYR